MVRLTTNILRESESFEEFYKTPKSVFKMSNKEIKTYLATYGEVNNNEKYDFDILWPIASPIDRPKKGLEFRSGETGQVEYFGPAVSGVSDKETDSYLNNINHKAHFSGRKINFDTYFNKVLYEAWKRDIIKLNRRINHVYMGKKKVKFDEPMETMFLNDLFSLRMGRAFTRDSLQRKRFKEEFDALKEFEKMSRENNDEIYYSGIA